MNMNEYVIKIKTAKNIGEEAFLRDFIYSWYNNKEELIRPEKFSRGEPIKHYFAKEGIEAVVQMWLNCGALMFKRISNPKYDVDINWRREKGKDPREFPWSCNVWLNKKAGDNLAEIFFAFLIEYLEPAYGIVSTYEHEKSNHFIKFRESETTTVEYFEGTDVGIPFPRHGRIQQNTIPGIYWLTYFSNGIIEKIGKEKFMLIPQKKIIKYKNGLAIKAYERCFDIDFKAEDEIKSIFGKNLFWDKKKYIEDNNLEIVE